MSDKNLTNQLKALKAERAGGTPDARWLASTRETILMQVSNTVGGQSRKTGFAALIQTFSFFSAEFAQAAAVPLAVIVLMFGAHFGAAGVVSLAQGTLPGDALYGAKLSAERVSLLFASRESRAQLELEISGRRLDEMSRIAAGTDSAKDQKLAEVSGRFAGTMSQLRADLVDLQAHGDDRAALRVALDVDRKSDEFQKVFAQSTLRDRPNVRLALLSLDQVAVQALEVMVEKRTIGSNVLPEAQLTSVVGQRIDTFAAHVAAGQDAAVTAKAVIAVAEAKAFLSNGDFQAAVRRVIEGTDLVTNAQNADATASATGTPAEATSTKPTP